MFYQIITCNGIVTLENWQMCISVDHVKLYSQLLTPLVCLHGPTLLCLDWCKRIWCVCV